MLICHSPPCFFSFLFSVFEDPSSFDFLLNKDSSSGKLATEDCCPRDSLFVKFDPLFSNANMLSEGSVEQSEQQLEQEKAQEKVTEIEREEKEPPIKQEILTPKETVTPKRNPAVVAIDKLLYFSPATPRPNHLLDVSLHRKLSFNSWRKALLWILYWINFQLTFYLFEKWQLIAFKNFYNVVRFTFYTLVKIFAGKLFEGKDSTNFIASKEEWHILLYLFVQLKLFICDWFFKQSRVTKRHLYSIF